MKVHPLIAAAVIGAFFALQGWTLNKVNKLSEDVAVIKVRLDQSHAAVTPSATPRLASVDR